MIYLKNERDSLMERIIFYYLKIIEKNGLAFEPKYLG